MSYGTIAHHTIPYYWQRKPSPGVYVVLLFDHSCIDLSISNEKKLIEQGDWLKILPSWSFQLPGEA